MRAMIIKTAVLMLLLLLSAMTTIYPQQHAAIPDLEQLIEEALQNNPAYRSAVYEAQQANQTISQAGALPDPILGLSAMNMPVDNFAFDQEPMTGKKLSLMQMFPFPGKLGLKEDIAAWQAKVIEYQVEELKNNLIKNVKLTYYNLFFVEKSLTIVKKNKELLKQFISVAETKYSVGKGLQQDVLKAQVEFSKLNDRMISLNQKRENLVFQLNKLLNRDIKTVIKKLPEFNKTEVNFSLENLQELGLEQRSLLKSWGAMIKKTKSANKLAKKGYLPDFSLAVAYTQRDDLLSGMKMYDFFSAEVKLNLPLYFYKKQSKKVEETKLMISSVEEKYAAVRNEVFFQIENSLSELRKNEQLIDLYKTGIIPQASQSLNSAMSGYQVDKVDFLTLINNQMTLFNYEMEYYRVLSEYEKSLAQLETAVGKML
ncbi:MAG: TolC family protein [bacterium]|nr:TolC family protein [bacterium]